MRMFLFLVLVFQSLVSSAKMSVETRTDTAGISTVTRDTARINVLNKIAFDYSSRNSFLSEKYANLALLSSLKLGYVNGIGEAYKTLGLAFLDQTRYPEALDALLAALKITEESHNLKQQANVLNDIGYFYNDVKQFSRAIEYYNLAIKINKTLHRQTNEIDCRENIVEALLNQGEYSASRVMVSDLLKRSVAIDYQPGIGDAYQNLGLINASSANYTQAIDFYLKAVTIYTSIGDDLNRLVTLNRIARVYIFMEDPIKARKYTMLAIDQSPRIGSSKIEFTGYRYLSKIDSMTGDFRSSLINFKRFTNLKDSIESAGKALRMEEIHSNFILKSQNKNISLLQKDRILQDQRLKGKNTLIYIFLAFFIVVAFLFVVAGYFYRQKKDAVLSLEAKTEELEMLNGVKDKLFSVISHDLRSPLANLEAILSLMETGDLSIEEVVMLASQLTQNVQDTSNMLDNLLQWSKSQMQGIKPNYEKANLGLLVNDIIYFYRGQADKKAITVRTLITEPSSTYADQEMMKLVIRNLLANAIKFTPTGGRIHVEIRSDNQNVTVSVKDSGLGISENNKSRLFSSNNFTTSGTHDEKGTGLGLLLCRDFVEKNNGRIWVESQLGEGSTFSFSLPLIEDLAQIITVPAALIQVRKTNAR